MRFAVALPCALVVGACYSPNAEVTTGDDDDDSTGSADSTGSPPTTSASTTTADTSGTQGSSGSSDSSSDVTHGDTDEDAPPEIENFEVQGSQMPAEILMADTVVLQADVSDDVAVARVEFYDGDELVATVDGAPYRTEFLVTSADNGGHSYTAIAYDSSDQTDEAGPIPLSVGIDGGAVVELREDVFRSRNLVWILGAPAVTIAADGDVVLTGTAVYQGVGFTNARATTIRYNSLLSELWQRDYPGAMTSVTPALWVHSAPQLRDEDFALLTVTRDGSDDVANAVLPLSSDGAVGTSIDLEFEDLNVTASRGLVIDPAGEMVAVTTEGVLNKLDSLGNVLWQESSLASLASGAYFARVSLDPDGNIFVDLVEFSGDESFLRKYSPDGALLWTRDNGGVSQPLADGSVVSVGSWFTPDALTLLHRDTDGNELSSAELDVEFPYTVAVADMAATPDGDIVCVGMRQTLQQVPEAWVARATPDGDTTWWTMVEVGDRTVATGVAVSEEGRLYVTGHADDVPAPQLLQFFADTWVAELAL